MVEIYSSAADANPRAALFGMLHARFHIDTMCFQYGLGTVYDGDRGRYNQKDDPDQCQFPTMVGFT